MFLQVCVCPQGGGCLPQCMLECQTPPGPGKTPQTRQTPPDQADPPWTRQTPPDQADPPAPPGSTLQHAVYERPVRILLECILVIITIV